MLVDKRFRAPHRMKSRCSKLRVNGEVLSNKENLLSAWADHFSRLSKSHAHSEEGLKQLGNKINDLAFASLSNEEHILDVPFTLEEVKCAIMKLKSRKSCGPDGLSAEHLKWGGDSLHLWLLGIVNSIIDFEEIPSLFKLGSICPIYKGGGKDPLLINNYRGITVNSMFSKVLEILILSRLEPTLSEVDFPHLNQSAYRKHTGCTDAIFATQELIARYISEGSTVYMCLFDLQKAFDSIEFPVLLDKLFSIGINGKTWRLIRNWYESGKCFVYFAGLSSAPFPVERGVRQGSILSPTLFNIIMNPLLLTLEASGLGLSVNNLYGGAYLHADDIRTLASTASTLQAQISEVLKFTSNNFLQLNPAKCEIISFAQHNTVHDPVCEIEGKQLPASGTAKCLGYSWNHNLSAKPSIEHNILKARKSFFAYGSLGLFKGDLSPLSGRSMVETCILPILLYGTENWCLSQNSIQMLDSFLGELSKRLLKLPRWYSNTPASIVVGLMSARALCLTRKLNFLRKISIDKYSETLSSQTLRSLSDDIDSVCLIRECRDLEQFFHSNFTSTILQIDADTCPRPYEIKEDLQTRDQDLRLTQHEGRADMSIVVEVERAVGWPRLWDLALDYGPKCVDGLRNLVRVVAFPPHASSACPLCDKETISRGALLSHVLKIHSRIRVGSDELLSLLYSVTNSNSALFKHLCSLASFF